MCPEPLALLANRRGISLVTAIFTIVILSLFGLLIARYTMTTQISSADDYLWAQSLYSAESTARLNILRNDKGGTLPAKPTLVQPTVGQVPTAITADDFSAASVPANIRVRATDASGVSREIEVKYIL